MLRWFRRSRLPLLPGSGELRVLVDGEHWTECKCCGDRTRVVIGWIERGSATIAAYFVRWVPSKLGDHGATIRFIVGRWGDGTEPRHRALVEIDCRWIEDRPSFMVRDADPSDLGAAAATALRRSEVIGTPFAAEIFALADGIWAEDPRLEELRLQR